MCDHGEDKKLEYVKVPYEGSCGVEIYRCECGAFLDFRCNRNNQVMTARDLIELTDNILSARMDEIDKQNLSLRYKPV